MNPPARYLVLIESDGGMVAHLFDAQHAHQGEFDASSFEVADMTAGVVPTQGLDGEGWSRALAGHSAAERANALVYALNP